MNKLNLTEDFINNLLAITLENRDLLIKDLVSLFQSDINLIAFKGYLSKNGKVDKKIFQSYVESVFSKGVFYVYNIEKPHSGGFNRIRYPNYYSFKEFDFLFDKINSNYWNSRSDEENELFEYLSSFDLYEDRDKITMRDKAFLLNDPDYKFFNISNWKKIIDHLTEYFYKNYIYDKKISKKDNLERWRYISFVNIALLFEKKYFFSELKRGYVHNTNVYLELISSELNYYVDFKEYLTTSDDYKLVRLGINSNIGLESFGQINRIGNYSTENILKHYFTNFKAQSNVLKVYSNYLHYCLVQSGVMYQS
jgi:hypothetical protein